MLPGEFTLLVLLHAGVYVECQLVIEFQMEMEQSEIDLAFTSLNSCFDDASGI